MTAEKTAQRVARHSVLPAGVFTLIYIAVASYFAFSGGTTEFLVYIGVILLLMLLVWTIHRRINIHPAALWALSLWGLAHMLGGLLHIPGSWPINGETAVLYNLWLLPGMLKFDQLVHAYGFGITTWVCWQGIRAIMRTAGIDASPTAGLLLLSAAAGMGFGALNEVVEFFTTLIMPETNVGGYVNTGWDLVANLAGATIAVLLIYRIEK